MIDFKVRAGELENGKLLKRLKDRAAYSGDPENHEDFLKCLRDAKVLIPGRYVDTLNASPDEAVRFRPEILFTEGAKTVFPVFTTEHEMSIGNLRAKTSRKVDFREAADMAYKTYGCDALSVDYYSVRLDLSPEQIDSIFELESIVDDREVPEAEIYPDVRSCIDEISFPESLDNLYSLLNSDWPVFDIEKILFRDGTARKVPGWAKPGDIVFFILPDAAGTLIENLKAEAEKQRHWYSIVITEALTGALDCAAELCSLYAGKLFAVGQVAGQAENPEDYTVEHIFVLENPVDISEFDSFIPVSGQNSVSAVQGDDFDRLRNIIANQNDIPEYFSKATAASV